MKGIIGKKVGMTQIFDEKGQVIPVTVIQAGPCYVTQIRTEDKDGYLAVQLGFEELPPKRNGDSRLTQPKRGHLKRNGMDLPDLRYLREFRVRSLDVAEGQKLSAADVFQAGDRIAQMILARTERVSWIEETAVSETQRGEGGFGSSGVK